MNSEWVQAALERARVHTEKLLRYDLELLGLDIEDYLQGAPLPSRVKILLIDDEHGTYRGLVVDGVLEIDRRPKMPTDLRMRLLTVVHRGSPMDATLWAREHEWDRAKVRLASRGERIRGSRERLVLVGEINPSATHNDIRAIFDTERLVDYLNTGNKFGQVR